jgi:transposase-like protein
MPRPKRKFSREYKLAAIEQVWGGKSVPEVAAACEVFEAAIYLWIRELGPGGKKAYSTTAELEAAFGKGTGGHGDKRRRPVISRRTFTKAFKKEVVEQVAKGRPVAEIAKQYKIGEELAYRWFHQAYPERKIDGSAGVVDLAVVETRLAPGKKKDARKMTAKGKGVRQKPGRKKAKEQRKARLEEQAVRAREASEAKAARVAEMVADPLVWLQNHTETKDSHWREAGAGSCYRPFPKKPYFRTIADAFQNEPILFVEKSRDMMLSWLCVGLFTHAAMTIPGIEVLFQSQKEEKAFELVGYAKTLYERQENIIRHIYPLKRGGQTSGAIEFAHGSRIIGIPGGGNQIRSYHPWGLLQDEAAFMPQAGESYDHAVPVCQKIVVVSSAGPGWFSEQCQIADDDYSTSVPQGVGYRRMPDGRPVYRVHYSADPERGAEWVARERKKHSSQGSWDREQEIIHEAGGGERLFAEILNRYAEKILIDPYSSGFQPSPHWKRLGGFDHGKANPTGALVACIDYDGVIYILGEYYQPGLSPAEHRPNLFQLNGFLQAEVYADPSIFYKTQAQEGGKFKAIAELYADVGINNLLPAPENHELLGMERILAHWHDLDRREPTLKIVCPREQRDISRPLHGVHNGGCPNLLWELRRARREELSATQLVLRNPTERIVDKDNHLRDALKYLCLALPAPTQKTAEIKAQEAMALVPAEDITSRMIRYEHAFWEEQKKEPRIGLGRRGMWNARRSR